MADSWQRVGRPGYFSSRKPEIVKNYDKIYGEKNWRLVWDLNGRSFGLDGALMMYEEAYLEHFKKHPDELEWIAKNFSDVYDNNPSNVESGLDYSIQEFGGNHYQDIAIRRCLVRNGMWFEGDGLLEIRIKPPGEKWNPSNIPFHKPSLIPKPELKGWWKAGSTESFYQSAKYLEVKKGSFIPEDEIYFITSNKGKVESARRALGEKVKLVSLGLDIDEDKESVEEIAKKKALVAHSALCRPVICDDSGFVIPSMNGWPGIFVGRETQSNPGKFDQATSNGPVPAYFMQSLAYMDETLQKPKLFTSKVTGLFLPTSRGDISKKFIKNRLLGGRFIIDGQDKTIAELTEEEYGRWASTDRWPKLISYLDEKKSV